MSTWQVESCIGIHVSTVHNRELIVYLLQYLLQTWTRPLVFNNCYKAHFFQEDQEILVPIKDRLVLLEDQFRNSTSSCYNPRTPRTSPPNKAYDTVDREEVMATMEEYGMGPNARRLLQAFWDSQKVVA